MTKPLAAPIANGTQTKQPPLRIRDSRHNLPQKINDLHTINNEHEPKCLVLELTRIVRWRGLVRHMPTDGINHPPPPDQSEPFAPLPRRSSGFVTYAP
jgi:hypothetical protein